MITAKNTNELRAALLQEHSKAQKDQIMQWVGSNAKRFAMLTQLLLQNEEVVAQRASWPLSYAVEMHPALLTEQSLAPLLQLLEGEHRLHNAVTRNILRSMQFIHVPESLEGQLMNRCFCFLESAEAPNAVKALSLVLLGRLGYHYPEIMQEIKIVIEAPANKIPSL